MKSEGSFKNEALFKPVRLFIVISTVIYLAIAGFFTWRVFQSTHEFKEYRSATAETLSGKKRLTDIKEWFEVSKKWDNTVEKGETSDSIALEYYHQAMHNAILIAVISLLYLIIVFFIFRSSSYLFKYISFALAICSFVFLVIGVCTPMLEIGFFVDELNLNLPEIGLGSYSIDLSKYIGNFDGRMYFFYHIKSIYDVIVLLFTHDNIIVGTCILVFSIINPVLKLACTLAVLFSKKQAQNKLINFIVHYLGKWSMADVFVVSVFLGYLSLQNMTTGVDSEVNVLIGLYFFLTFVVFSLLSSTFIKMSQKKEKETVLIK